jgi:hypothetical protein
MCCNRGGSDSGQDDKEDIRQSNHGSAILPESSKGIRPQAPALAVTLQERGIQCRTHALLISLVSTLCLSGKKTHVCECVRNQPLNDLDLFRWLGERTDSQRTERGRGQWQCSGVCLSYSTCALVGIWGLQGTGKQVQVAKQGEACLPPGLSDQAAEERPCLYTIYIIVPPKACRVK